MRDRAQAVVIGGGVVGCSILYHLARAGWTETVLLERDELTAGSTWHAAANIHGLHDSPAVSRLQHYTMALYRELEAETGQSCGVFQPGSLYLAQTEERERQLLLQEARARRWGMAFHEVSRDEAERLHPLADFDGVRRILFEPQGGNVDPSGVTQAYAAGARARGAEIRRFTPATATEALPGGGWLVRTPQGQIRADWVVNAAGLWAREVAALAGLTLPLLPTEHQYLVTETIPAIAALGRRLPSIADRDGEYYLRQEGLGLLIGAYERDLRFWAEDGTPPDFGRELFPDDLGRIEENLARAMRRVPAAAEAGIKRVVNGPMIWSPDGAALFGPVPELKNYFLCAGIIPGFSQSGGLGKLAAEWMAEGEPSLDLFAWDLARFGAWADRAFTRARVRDQYANRFRIHFPAEEREAGRPARMRPAYARQQAMGAVFGLAAGWENPLWYAADGEPRDETAGFGRRNWHEPVGREARMLRARAGVLDVSAFARYAVRGPAARVWLDAVFAGAIPSEPGRIRLTPLIGRRGGVAGDFTVTCLAEDDFLVVGSGVAERAHLRLFREVPLPPGATFESLTERTCAVAVAGPLSRAILEGLADADLSNAGFPFMRGRRMRVSGVAVTALRLSFTGDLGWELVCDAADHARLWGALIAAARRFGAGPVGSRTLTSLRIEKGYGSWGREITAESWPQELGLDRLIRLDKGRFLNSEACAAVLERPPRERLAIFALDATEADAWGGEPIFLPDGEPVGLVTSGAWGWSVGRSIALGFLREGAAAPGDAVEIAVLGRPHAATLLARPPFDPDGLRLRG